MSAPQGDALRVEIYAMYASKIWFAVSIGGVITVVEERRIR